MVRERLNRAIRRCRFGKTRLCKAIGPAQIIPIIHVKRQRYDAIGVKFPSWHSAYPVIYWGVAASTLRRVQF